MNKKYDDIIAFAELQDFQERPFKQLSSGMKSRLAFSIACLVNPDILILDEVLSVGDGAFRKKSEAKMHELLAGGVTGLLVSHSIDQVRSMCNKILWIDHGKQICFSDNTDFVCDAYEEFLITKKVPEGENGIAKLASDYQLRLEKKRKMSQKSEQERLMELLMKGNPDAAKMAAAEYLAQYPSN